MIPLEKDSPSIASSLHQQQDLVVQHTKPPWKSLLLCPASKRKIEIEHYKRNKKKKEMEHEMNQKLHCFGD